MTSKTACWSNLKRLSTCISSNERKGTAFHHTRHFVASTRYTNLACLQKNRLIPFLIQHQDSKLYYYHGSFILLSQVFHLANRHFWRNWSLHIVREATYQGPVMTIPGRRTWEPWVADKKGFQGAISPTASKSPAAIIFPTTLQDT